MALGGLGLHLVMGVLIGATTLIAPGWAVAVLGALWLALLAVGLRAWRSRRWVAVAVPLAMAAGWGSLVLFGSARLGWGA